MHRLRSSAALTPAAPGRGRAGSGTLISIAAAAALAAGALIAIAPRDGACSPHGTTGGDLLIVGSLGSLGDDFGTGVGIEPFAVWRIDRAGTLGLRLAAGLIDFGSSTRNLVLPGPTTGIVSTNKRSVTTLMVGPQLSWQRGRLRPYAFATAGAGFFDSEVSALARDSTGFPLLLTDKITRTVMGAGAGGGLWFMITPRVALDAGAEYRRYRDVRIHGNDLAEAPNGALLVALRKGDAHFLVIRLGVTASLPLPGGRGGPHGERADARGG